MTKTDFMKKIKAEGLDVALTEMVVKTKINSEIDYMPYMVGQRVDRIRIRPEPYEVVPGFICYFTPVYLLSKTRNPWSKTNADTIGDQLQDYRRLWKKELAAYKNRISKTPEYRQAKRQQEFRKLCLRAGLQVTFENPYERGDHFSIEVVEVAWKKQDLDHLHATGAMIGLAKQHRRRVYAKSSDWRPSERTDTFVVGENESGSAFAHQVPNHIHDLSYAMDWIWRGTQITARQGDIGIAAGRIKHIEGETGDIPVGGGHSRHRFIGEYHLNGALHVRSGFLIHIEGQHPPVYLDGSSWRRLIVARRSEVGMSSRD